MLRQYGGKLRGPYYQPLGLAVNTPGVLKKEVLRCYENMERIGKGDLLKIYENLGLSLAYPIHHCVKKTCSTPTY